MMKMSKVVLRFNVGFWLVDIELDFSLRLCPSALRLLTVHVVKHMGAELRVCSPCPSSHSSLHVRASLVRPVNSSSLSCGSQLRGLYVLKAKSTKFQAAFAFFFRTKALAHSKTGKSALGGPSAQPIIAVIFAVPAICGSRAQLQTFACHDFN